MTGCGGADCRTFPCACTPEMREAVEAEYSAWADARDIEALRKRVAELEAEVEKWRGRHRVLSGKYAAATQSIRWYRAKLSEATRTDPADLIAPTGDGA